MKHLTLNRALCLAGVALLVLALSAPTAAGQSSDTRLAQQSLPDPDKPRSAASTKGSRGKKLPKTGLGAIPLVLIGLGLIASGRKVRPRPRPRPSAERYVFELQRRRYLSERD